jgi:hypothetical protein
MENVFIGIIIMYLFNWYAKYYIQNSIELLNDEQKLKLINLSKSNGKYSTLIMIALLCVYFLALKYELLPSYIIIIVFFLLIIVFMIYSYFITLKKLKIKEFPKEYNKKFIISFLIRFIGLIIFISVFLFFK